MASIRERPLAEDLSFGVRVSGVDWQSVEDEAVRQRIRALFEERGLIVFEDVEPSDEMLVALSEIVGPLQDLSLQTVSRVDRDTLPGVVTFNNEPSDCNIFEIEGVPLSGWLSWHFDACYSARAQPRGRAARGREPARGRHHGLRRRHPALPAISPELRAEFQQLRILYHGGLMFQNQRFGLPDGFRMLRLQDEAWTVLEEAGRAPRAIHPAVWRRSTGEYVLHACPFQAAGIEGREGPEGDARLEALFREIYAVMTPYWHTWKPTDMIVWDNWRFIHSASGHPPEQARRVHRTTIEGDYGLGCLESEPAVSAS